jgi:hypothetical protein
MNSQANVRHAIAVAAAKVKKRLHTVASRRNDPADLDLEVSRTGLGALLAGGALIGFGGVVCLISGLVRSGPLALMRGWLAALFGS